MIFAQIKDDWRTFKFFFVDRISPKTLHASIPYVLPDKCTSSTSGFSIRGLRYGRMSSRDSNFRVAALMVKQRGSGVDVGLEISAVAIYSNVDLCSGITVKTKTNVFLLISPSWGGRSLRITTKWKNRNKLFRAETLLFFTSVNLMDGNLSTVVARTKHPWG